MEVCVKEWLGPPLPLDFVLAAQESTGIKSDIWDVSCHEMGRYWPTVNVQICSMAGTLR